MITLKLDGGIEVTVSTTAEAAALVRELRNTTQTSAPAPRAPATNGAGQTPAGEEPAKLLDADQESIQTAVKFLTAIRDAGPSGAHSEILIGSLGLSKPKAIGSRAASINRLIEAIGLKPRSVYANPRNREGKRLWKPGKRIDQALAAFQQQLAAH